MQLKDNKQNHAYEKKNINKNLQDFRLNLFVNGLMSNPMHLYAGAYVARKLNSISRLSDLSSNLFNHAQNTSNKLLHLRKALLQTIDELENFQDAESTEGVEYIATLHAFSTIWNHILETRQEVEKVNTIHITNNKLEESLQTITSLNQQQNLAGQQDLITAEKHLTHIAQTLGVDSEAYAQALQNLKKIWKNIKGVIPS